MEKIFLIYSYEFTNHVYVGLTKNLQRRHHEHMTILDDTVFLHAKNNGINIPEPKILEQNLTSLESQAKEKNWLEYYSSMGYIILNKGECGIFKSSLGNCSSIKNDKVVKNKKVKNTKTLTYESCYSIAKMYIYKRDFQEKNGFEYRFSKKMGWLSDFSWLQNYPRKKVNKTEITYEDYLQECKKYKSKSQLSKYSRKFYLYGLKYGYNDIIFKKNVSIKTSEKYQNSVYDDIKDELLTYNTKTELYKKNHGLYELCRKNNWLNVAFPKKNKIKETYKKEKDYNIILPENYIECEKYPSYLIDNINGKIYKRLKTKIHLLESYSDNTGIIFYNLYVNNNKISKPYHVFLGEFKKEIFNSVKYIDNNVNNLKENNLAFEIINIENYKPINGYPHLLISSNGEIYSKKHFSIFKGFKKTEEGYYCYGYKIDKLVYSLFKENINGYKGEIIHLDGDIYNNNINNLHFTITYKNINDILFLEKTNESTSFNIKIDNCKIHLCTLSDERTISEFYSDISKRIKSNYYIKQWIYDYIKNIIPVYQTENNERNLIKQKTLSSGCYWWEPRKKWKSKIFYNGKEYSLGYFEDFESGKILYEIATLYIQHHKFEEWYENIKQEKNIINNIFI